MNVVRLPLILLLAAVLSACVSHAPVPLYQLDAGDARTPVTEDGIAVLLGPVSIADYLQREALLQRQEDGSLTTATNGRWAGSLAADIDQQLLRQLASQLDTQQLVLAPAAPGFVPQVQIKLAISRLDSGPSRPAVLEAQWSVLSKDGKLLNGRLIRLEESHSGGLADQVQAQSRVMRRLVAQLASAVRDADKAASVAQTEAPRRKAAAAPAKPEAPPRMPVAEPIRIDAEVFRF